MKLLLLAGSRLLVGANGSHGSFGGQLDQREFRNSYVSHVAVRHENNRIVVHVWGRRRADRMRLGRGGRGTLERYPHGDLEAGLCHTPDAIHPAAGWPHAFGLSLRIQRQFRTQRRRARRVLRPRGVGRETPDAGAARAVLQQVSEAYQQPAGSAFRGHPDHRPSTANERTPKHYPRDDFLSGADELRVETKDAGEPSVLIADGQTSWTVFPGANEYRSVSRERDGAVSLPGQLRASRQDPGRSNDCR